jgi:hypothetical protein
MNPAGAQSSGFVFRGATFAPMQLTFGSVRHNE